MPCLYQRIQYAFFETVFQTAPVNGSIGQPRCGTRCQVGRQFIGKGFIEVVPLGGGTQFVGYACSYRSGNNGFDRVVAAQFFQGFADVAFVVDERNGSTAVE